MLIISELPGQEEGNGELFVSAGAACWARGPLKVVSEVGRLKSDPAALAGMRAASAGLARPEAAKEVGALLCELAGFARGDRVVPERVPA